MNSTSAAAHLSVPLERYDDIDVPATKLLKSPHAYAYTSAIELEHRTVFSHMRERTAKS
jgi:hypothetical protein